MGHGKSVYPENSSGQFKEKEFNKPKKVNPYDWPNQKKYKYPPHSTKEFTGQVNLEGHLIGDKGPVSIAYNAVIREFFEVRAKYFPTWEGLPEIILTWDLPKRVLLTWIVRVPFKFLAQPLDEDSLWDE